MQGKMSFGDLYRQMQGQAEYFHDELIPTSDMRFEGLDVISLAGKIYGIQPTAQKILANKLGVPIQYLRRCPDSLQATNLNHWIEKLPQEELFCRMERKELRAVFTTKYKPIDHLQIMERMLNQGFDAHDQVHYLIDQEIMVLNIPDHNRTFTVNGDRLTPGISLINSEVGFHAFFFFSFFLRLVCTNGLISKTSVSARFRHVSTQVMDKLPQVLNQVVEESNRNRDQFQISLNHRVHDPLETINSFNRQFQLTKQEAEAVQNAWYLEEGYSMFAVMNTYTRAAQDRDLVAESAYRLQRVGGEILNLVK